MKKLMLLMILWICAFPLLAQNVITISGTVNDSATGTPVVNHPVYIQSDSANGLYYFNVVFTNANGYYIDHMPFNPASTTGIVTIYTYDCYQSQISYTHTYSNTVTTINQNFIICSTNTGCHADYSYFQSTPLGVQFSDASLGVSSARFWDFGDGSTSNELNPFHFFPVPGVYPVSLTIGVAGTNCFDVETKMVHVTGDTIPGDCLASFYTIQYPMSPGLVQFINQSLGNIQTYSWDFGDNNGTTITYPGNPNVTHQYAAPGNYIACLTIIGFDSLCNSTYCTPVIIDSINTTCYAAFTHSSPSSSNQVVYFFDQSFTPIPVSWLWDFGDGTYSTEQNPVHTYPFTTAPVPYNVCLTITSVDSTCYDMTCQLIYVGGNTACQAEFSAYPIPGTMNTIQFDDQSTGNIQTWTWEFGDGVTQIITFPQNPDVTHYYQAPGVYTACLYIQGPDSCLSTYCEAVIVGDSLPGCQAYFNYTYDPANSALVHFFDQSLGAATDWFWDFGDGTTSTEQNPTHLFPVIPGPYATYNVCLTIMSPNLNCYDTFCKIVIIAANQNCYADFTATQIVPSPSLSYQVFFDDISAGNIQTWTWDFGDGNIEVINYPENPDVYHTYTVPGFYNVCLNIVGSDSCYDYKCETIAVSDSIPGCQAQYTYYPLNSNAGNSIQFIDLSSGSPTQWFWNFGDGTSSSLQNPVHTFGAPGTYYVCLTIGGPYCQSVWCADVEVGPTINCVNYFTYSNIGLSVNFQGYMVTGVNALYTWDFGDNNCGVGENVIHTYSNPGIYFVTLTTTTTDPGVICTYTSSQMVTVGDSTTWNQLYGQVFAGNFPVTQGMVMLMSVDTTNTFVPFVDVTMLDSAGVYYFPMVPQGNYVIYAIPFIYGFLPTYYGNVLYWQDATVITLGSPNNPYNIYLIEGDSYSAGNGNISGQVTQGDISSSLIDKVTILLKDDQGNVILFRQVDDLGNFNFPQLAYGTYYLYAELAGCESQTIKVVIAEATPNATVNLTLSGSSILGREDQALTIEAGVVYPNPVRDIARIALTLNTASTIRIEIVNMAGQQVIYQEENLNAGQTIVSIPVNQLNSGVYSLRVSTHEGLLLTRKLVK